MHPWWPNTKLPGGSGPWPQSTLDQPAGRSGSLALTSASEGLTAAVCTATFDKATPVVVEVGVLTTAGGQPFAAPSSSASDCSSLVFEYGSGATSRKVRTDLRPGTYQLPPCETVRVSVFASDINVNINVAI